MSTFLLDVRLDNNRVSVKDEGSKFPPLVPLPWALVVTHPIPSCILHNTILGKCTSRYLDPYDRRISVEVCREPENLHDRRAVCIKKGGAIVGHVALTAILVKFIDHGGTISCRVRGRPQQGKGLEVPCSYILVGKEETITAMQKYLSTLHIV